MFGDSRKNGLLLILRNIHVNCLTTSFRSLKCLFIINPGYRSYKSKKSRSHNNAIKKVQIRSGSRALGILLIRTAIAKQHRQEPAFPTGPTWLVRLLLHGGADQRIGAASRIKFEDRSYDTNWISQLLFPPTAPRKSKAQCISQRKRKPRYPQTAPSSRSDRPHPASCMTWPKHRRPHRQV